MHTSAHRVGDYRFEVLTSGDDFLGLGAIRIGETKVRSGRLPLNVCTQSFWAQQLGGLRLDTAHEEGGEMLGSCKQLQDHGVYFPIESLGPFGQSLRGGPRSYNLENLFAICKICLGSGCATIPTGGDTLVRDAEGVDKLCYALAHMTGPKIQMFVDGVRVDTIWSPAPKRALADYHDSVPRLHQRCLQPDNRSVIRHDDSGTRATIFVFEDKTARIAGNIHDLTTGETVPAGPSTALKARHTYLVSSRRRRFNHIRYNDRYRYRVACRKLRKYL